ncbi:hypothetical protein [Serratia marcescens]|uniref:hypothetical protein n=1 Tax=Serratia marcescens TaxID=615 RepID=UPI001F48B160|nr:hypothetical protein [Serratia marcescens]UIM57457.1 hypothetical protein LXH15_10315 [Serratia marcescens]
MSNNNVKNIIEKISDYRSVSSSIVDLQMELILELASAINEIKEKSGVNPSERELGKIELYNRVTPIIRSSLSKINQYNNSIKGDYIEAIKLLSKLQGGKNNVDG